MPTCMCVCARACIMLALVHERERERDIELRRCQTPGTRNIGLISLAHVRIYARMRTGYKGRAYIHTGTYNINARAGTGESTNLLPCIFGAQLTVTTYVAVYYRLKFFPSLRLLLH